MTDKTAAALMKAADEARAAGDQATESAARAALAAAGRDPFIAGRRYGA